VQNKNGGAAVLCTGFVKEGALDVHHEVTAADVLHHEKDAVLGLEARVQLDKERMPCLVCKLEHLFLRLDAGHLVVLNNKVLLEHLDGVDILGRLFLHQHDLQIASQQGQPDKKEKKKK